jgi:hypothetical protein
MRSASRILVVAVPLIVCACGRGAPGGASAEHASSNAAASAAAPAAKGTLAIGEPITRPVVPLAEIASNPARYASGVVATSGKVTAVCQEMGCWMEMQDASGQAHVRMHGHSFFVPKTASGHIARVQATIVTRPDDNECEEGATAKAAHPALAKVELDATGIELD